MSSIFTSLATTKKEIFANYRLGKVRTQWSSPIIDRGNDDIFYHQTYLAPYHTLKDFRANAQACILKPLINLEQCLQHTLTLLNFVLISLVKLLTLDVSNAYDNLLHSSYKFLASVYFAASVVTDTVVSLLQLITHSGATLLFGAQAFKDQLINRMDPPMQTIQLP